MRRLVVEGAADPLVRERAAQIVAASPRLHPVEALFRFVQGMPYVKDEALGARLGLDEADDTSEIVQGAPYQLALERAGGRGAVPGDCDCRSVLLQSMLEARGYRTAFVLVRGLHRPDFSHVYSEARGPGLEGAIALDTIMDGKGGRDFFDPGDAVRADQVTARRIIPVGGSFFGGIAGLAAIGLLVLSCWKPRRRRR